MSNQQNAAHRQRIRQRRAGRGGTVKPILLAEDLNTTPCRRATGEHDATQIKNMIATLLATDNGVGMAAPQIGYDTRIFIMRDKSVAAPLVFINPEIVARSNEMQTDKEGCLSKPGKFVQVERPWAVWLKWTDQGGKEQEKAFARLSARIIQHEMDHLQGFCRVMTHVNELGGQSDDDYTDSLEEFEALEQSAEQDKRR